MELQAYNKSESVLELKSGTQSEFARILTCQSQLPSESGSGVRPSIGMPHNRRIWNSPVLWNQIECQRSETKQRWWLLTALGSMLTSSIYVRMAALDAGAHIPARCERCSQRSLKGVALHRTLWVKNFERPACSVPRALGSARSNRDRRFCASRIGCRVRPVAGGMARETCRALATHPRRRWR